MNVYPLEPSDAQNTETCSRSQLPERSDDPVLLRRNPGHRPNCQRQKRGTQNNVKNSLCELRGQNVHDVASSYSTSFFLLFYEGGGGYSRGEEEGEWERERQGQVDFEAAQNSRVAVRIAF